MASLNGQTIASSYEQLLHVDRDGGGNTSNLVNVKDGDNGTTFCISMTDASTGKAILAVDGSHANGTEIQIDNSATDGDAFLSFQLSGTSKFTMGVDDGDSDKFKIGTTAIGTGTMFALDTNSKISLSNNDTSDDNTVFGFSAFNVGSDSSSHRNTAIGDLAMGTGAVAGAVDNVAVGYKALEDITSGDNNTGVGSNAGVSITTGSQCTAVGHQALDANQTASYLTAIGNNALTACTAGENTGVGWDAGGSIVGGVNNCMIGGNAGDTLTTGNQNTCLGDTADVSATGSVNQTVVGYATTGQADNSVTLGNSSVTAVYMAQDSGAIVHTAGIQFPATQVANAGANVLDDYEEGSYDISITPAGGGTYSVHTSYDEGAYTKIGRVAHVQGYVTITGNSSPVGDLRISLPFDAANLGNHSGTSGGTVTVYNMNFSGNFYTLQIDEGAAYFRIVEITDNSGHDYIEGTELSGDFYFNVTYVVA